MVYTLYPEQNVSLWIVDGFRKQNCSIACGYSIINKTCTTHVGRLMREFSGAAGTCQVPYEQANEAIENIVTSFKQV